MIITGFKDFGDTKTPFYTPVDKALERIRVGKSKSIVDQIRLEPDDKKRSALKRKLPCICFSGKFLARLDSALTQHSGLVILDFDKVADPAGLRDSMREYAFVYAAWVSPSGDGVKVLVRIPPVTGQHRGHYAALLRVFAGLDSTSCNESRICFESYDPDIYINADAVEFEQYLIPAEPVPPALPVRSAKTDYGKLNLCAAMIRNATEGNKHTALLKASRLAGGYVATGVVDEQIAVRLLEAEIENKPGIDDLTAARRTIQDGIAYGKRMPIYEQEPEEQPQQKVATQNGVVHLASAWERMAHGFEHGKKRGEQPTSRI